jgi:hypothetical protein
MNRIFVPSVATTLLLGNASVRGRRVQSDAPKSLSGRVGRMIAIAGVFAGISVITSASLVMAQETGRGNQTARPNHSEQVYSPNSGDR